MYRRAVLAADLAIADSSLMVLLWRLLPASKRPASFRPQIFETTSREIERPGDDRRVLGSSDQTRRAKITRSVAPRRVSFSVHEKNCYVAPWYGSEVEDRNLISLIEHHRPAHVIIAIGSGAAGEAWPLSARKSLLIGRRSIASVLHSDSSQAIRVSIPDWADRFYLGWFFRLLAQPRTFIPRLSRALELPWLIWKYGEKLPPMRTVAEGKK